MGDVTQVLASSSEISLKGANRRWFERQLTRNVRTALQGLPVVGITRPSWRVLVGFSDPVAVAEVAQRLGTVFGLSSIMPVEGYGRTLEEAEARLAELIERLHTATFAVRCVRSDKRFPLTSPDIERRIGTFVQERTDWSVDLRRPQLTLHILVEDSGFYLWTRRIPGPGGLPVGVSGRALGLLSGGIDSPVAAHHMMKRGMQLDFVHFHSMPRTDPASIDKVRELVTILNRFQHACRLALVPLLRIQESVVAQCPAELRVLLYRRFMFRIAEHLAARCRASALVTGEALGQVSSQTVENLAAVEAVTALPVLRPLIAFDKREIIAEARAMGSYEISIQPHTDCCSFLMSASPATRSCAADLEAAEAALDITGLVDQTLAETSIESSQRVADWREIPIPEEAAV